MAAGAPAEADPEAEAAQDDSELSPAAARQPASPDAADADVNAPQEPKDEDALSPSASGQAAEGAEALQQLSSDAAREAASSPQPLTSSSRANSRLSRATARGSRTSEVMGPKVKVCCCVKALFDWLAQDAARRMSVRQPRRCLLHVLLPSPFLYNPYAAL